MRWSRRLLRWGRPLYTGAGRVARWIGRRLRPLGVLSLRLLGFGERRARGLAARSARAATKASGVLTPERGICLTIVASAGFLLAAQFVDYRGIEVGQPGYAGLPEFARAPTEGLQSPVDAHSYALVPVALAVIVLALVVARGGNRRLGRVVFALGLASALVVLLVDRPAGLDLGEQAARFAGAHAVLTDGFYAQLASAAGMMLGGLLLLYAPQKRRVRSKGVGARKVRATDSDNRPGRKARPRKPSLARTQGGLRRERTDGA